MPSHALGTRRRVVEDVVGPVHEHRHPADPALRQGHVQPGEPDGHPRPQPFAGGQQGVDREDGGQELEGGPGEGRGAHAEAPVWRQITVPVSSQAANNGSQWSVKMEGKPSWAGNSGKLTALNPECGVGPHLVGGHGDVVEPRDLQRDDPVGMGSGPHLEVPVGSRPGHRPVPAPCRPPARTPIRRIPPPGTGSRPTPRSPPRPCRPRGRRCRSSPVASRRTGPAPCSTRRRGRPTTAFSPTFGYSRP